MVVANTFNPNTQEEERKADPCEFEIGLDRGVSSSIVRTTQKNAVSTNKNKTTTRKSQENMYPVRMGPDSRSLTY